MCCLQARADALQANLVETTTQLNALRKAMKLMQTDNQNLLESVSAAKAQAAVYASGSMRHLHWQVYLCKA